ncbi:MAG: hypothetical protein ACXWUU_14790 [Burkholderiales bacterium]
MISPATGSIWFESVLARLSPAAEQALKRCASYLLPFNPVRIPVVLLQGMAGIPGKPAKMLVAGADDWVSYLASRFFAAAPRREIVSEVPIWSLARVLRRLRGCADLTLAHVDHRSAQLYFNGDYLTVPDWVGASSPTADNLGRLARTSKSIANDIRKARGRWRGVELARAQADFEMFYERMDLPYVQGRFGAQAYVHRKSDLQRMFRRGGILRLTCNGAPLAGALFECNGSTMVLVSLGLAEGDVALLREGVFAALYVHCLDYAREHGCLSVDMRGCRPSLLDGVLRYKRKWGMSLYDKRDVLHATLVHWTRLDGPVAEFLAHTPLIFRDGDRLSAVAVVHRQEPWTSRELQRARDRLWVAGLRTLTLVADAPLPVNVSVPPDTRPIERTALSSAGPGALLAAVRTSPRASG